MLLLNMRLALSGQFDVSVQVRTVEMRAGDSWKLCLNTKILCAHELARIIHECRREAFETEVRRGFSPVRPTQVYRQSVEEAEREKPRRARGSDAGAGIHE